MYNKQQTNLEAQTLRTISPGEVIIGTLVEIDSTGNPIVDYPENPEDSPLVAVSTLGLTVKHKNRQVALLFANGDIRKPVIMGLIHNPLQEIIENFEVQPTNDDVELWSQDNIKHPPSQEKELQYQSSIDGKRIVLEGQEEIVLKCGEASITLTKAGKIIIRGKYLLNRSSGVNRIMGGSVQVN